MERTITVRGVGKLSLKPDLIEVSLILEAKDTDYAAAMDKAGERLNAMRGALCGIGFGREDLKSTYFNVRTEYDSVRDERGVYRQVFAGFVCEHHLLLRFGFDTEVLSKVLAALSECESEPNISVSFTVKDKEAVKDALLTSAAVSAKGRAEVLAAASGVKLGSLVTIDYGWAEPNFISPTRLAVNAKMRASVESADAMGGVSPENIELSENVTFVWQIESL